jgi:phosphoglycerate dehydrogenase-like enzyme
VTDHPRVLLCFNSDVRKNVTTDPDLARLERIAVWDWLPSEGQQASGTHPWDWGNASTDPADKLRLKGRIGEYDALIVCNGAPYIDAEVLDVAPRLGLIGELEGDRFANRIDVPTCAQRGVRVVDTTHGSSLPVAEWALGLILVSLRNAAPYYRKLIAGERTVAWGNRQDPGFRMSELTGRSVGLIGLGHIGRRLIELLGPFGCRISVHDPYVAKEVALAMHVQLTSLERVMSRSDVVVCCAPITPATYRMIGAQQLELLPDNSVFVNVSRGGIVDSDALIARARRGDVRVGLDVFDPEPIPEDSEIRRLPNVFVTPHIASFSAACGPRFFTFMVDELERYFAGDETLHDITPRVLANRRGTEPV